MWVRREQYEDLVKEMRQYKDEANEAEWEINNLRIRMKQDESVTIFLLNNLHKYHETQFLKADTI